MSSSMTEAEFTAECDARGFTVLIPGKHDVQVHGFVDIGDGIRVSRWNGGPDFASVLKYLVAVRKRQDEVLAVKAKIKGEKAPKAKAAEPEPVVEKPKPAAKPEKVNARVAAVEPSAKARKIAGGYTIVVKPGTKSDGVRFLARVAELPLVMADGETEDEARDECLVAATAAVEELLDSGMEPPKPKPAAAPAAKPAKAAPKPKAKVAGPGVKKGGGR